MWGRIEIPFSSRRLRGALHAGRPREGVAASLTSGGVRQNYLSQVARHARPPVCDSPQHPPSSLYTCRTLCMCLRLCTLRISYLSYTCCTLRMCPRLCTLRTRFFFIHALHQKVRTIGFALFAYLLVLTRVCTLDMCLRLCTLRRSSSSYTCKSKKMCEECKANGTYFWCSACMKKNVCEECKGEGTYAGCSTCTTNKICEGCKGEGTYTGCGTCTKKKVGVVENHTREDVHAEPLVTSSLSNPPEVREAATPSRDARRAKHRAADAKKMVFQFSPHYLCS